MYMLNNIKRREKTKFKFMATAIAVAYFASCATLFKGTTQDVHFNSNLQKARVIVNGMDMGETPVALKLETKKTYTVVFRAEGYKPKSYTISNRVGAGWIVLDVFTGLVGVIVDAATGAWYSLDQNNVDAVLDAQQPR